MNSARWNPFSSRRGPERIAAPVDPAEVAGRLGHLERAVALAGSHFPDDEVRITQRLMTKARQRSGLGSGQTIVALAGATGSGKSSLFNALVGADVSRVGVTRPTTSRASAATWGPTPYQLLDWIGVATSHEVAASAPGYDQFQGLVLLDLPDLDSRIAAHRAEADRILELCDVFVWVTDPQKYADAVLHQEYVREFAQTRASSVVVLNQVDRLTQEAAASCLADLARLLVHDGLSEARVVPASTAVPKGGEQFVEAVVDVVQSVNAADRRLAGDLALHARRLSSHVGAERTSHISGVDAELVDSLAQAAGVPVVLDAVQRDYVGEAAARTGWPFTRWAQRMRPKQLSRLGLDRVAQQARSRSERQVALGRSSLPPATPAARAAVELATRKLGDRAAADMPATWADEIHDVVDPHDDAVADALDQAVLSVPLSTKRPAWWAAAGMLQWCFAALAVAGAVWLAALAGLASVQIHLDAPTLGSWLPIPLLLLVGGLLAGLALAVLARALAARGARRARRNAQSYLNGAIERVARDYIVGPVAEIVRRHDECAHELAQASG